MQGKKKNLFSYNMHLVLPYLLNDSNDLLKEKFFQNPTLHDANLQWLVDFIFISSCLIKQSLWVQCCFVYSVTRVTIIFTALKAASSGKELIFFLGLLLQVGSQNANVSCWRQYETAWV